MSDGLNIQLTSNAAQIVAQLTAFPPAMLAGIARTLDYQNEITIGVIQRDKLSRRGPTTLGVVTNRLRSSISRAPARILEGGAGVVSVIGSNVVYLGAHEFGFTGTVTVRAHQRRLFDRHTTGGGKYLDPKSGRIRTTPRKTVRIQRGATVTVRAHQMKMNIKERAPIRTTLTARSPEYSQSISTTIVDIWNNPTAGSPTIAP